MLKNIRILKRVGFIFVLNLCFLPLFLNGCDNKKESGNNTDLVMVVSADLPPFAFHTINRNKDFIVGFDVELAQRICQYLGYELHIKDVGAADLIPSLKSKRADFAMSAITPFDVHRAQISYSSFYYRATNVMISLKENVFFDLKDIAGKKIGIQSGSTQEQFARIWAIKYPGAELVSLNSKTDMIQELLTYQVDGLIIEETIAKAFELSKPDVFKIEQLQDKESGFAIAFPKGSELIAEFEEALDHLQSIGYTDKLILKWFKSSSAL